MLRDDGYELFRRAIVDCDADAWGEIAHSYRAMLIAWTRRCQASELTGEQCEDLADEALARAWRALTPEHFAQFPNLAALMGYLHTCVTTTVIDAARARTAYERRTLRFELAHSTVEPPDQLVLEQLGRKELWRLASSVAVGEAERVVLTERFVFDLAPRQIQTRHPALFPDVRKIYETIRNLCARLRRNRDLQGLYDYYPKDLSKANQTRQSELSSFITQWLDQKDANIKSDTAELMQLRRSYGYWILLQRWELDISDDDITEQTGIDTATIELLQLGLANPTLASNIQWRRLAAILVDNDHKHAYVESIIYRALGDHSHNGEQPKEHSEIQQGRIIGKPLVA